MNIFGVLIEGLSLDDIFLRLKISRQPLWIVTANPEILLQARWDEPYRKAIQQADIHSVDGVGLSMIGRLFGQKWLRVTGVELGERLIDYAAQEQLRIAFVGGYSGIAERVAHRWCQTYPELSVLFEQGGSIHLDGTDDEVGEEARHRLTLFSPEILLLAFGHPKQERWIARHLADFPQLKVVVGVGGAFDYWAGRLPRAPRFLQLIGLEWAWRLCLEPRRVLRIIRAVFIFPVLAIVDHLFF